MIINWAMVSGQFAFETFGYSQLARIQIFELTEIAKMVHVLVIRLLYVFLFVGSYLANQDLNFCYTAPSCTGTEFYDQNTGFTNDTGWSSSFSNSCCQICLPGTPPTVCFDPDDDVCAEKTGNADYDFLLFDQVWLPQLCTALVEGHDPTLTHLHGTVCNPRIQSKSGLSIHGMWPNYVNGFPQCCNTTGDSFSLIPTDVTAWELWPELQESWPDPTSNTECSVCFMLNHEWEKHGACYSPGDPWQYFKDALQLSNKLTPYSKSINAYAGKTVLTSELAAHYPKAVNILCDPHSGNGDLLLEIQTCWDTNLSIIDCAPASPMQFTSPCPEYTTLSSRNTY